MKNVIVFTILIFMAMTAFADVNQALKNMEQRLPQIVELKKTKAVGEDNSGFLASLQNSPAAQALVNAENNDRRVVYASLAQKHGISADQIGKQRAIQIHQIAVKGTMLQDGSGKWYEK